MIQAYLFLDHTRVKVLDPVEECFNRCGERESVTLLAGVSYLMRLAMYLVSTHRIA